MMTMDQKAGSNVEVGQAVPELQWGMAGVPHSSFLTQLSAPGKLLHSIIFSLLSTKLRGIYSTTHLLYIWFGAGFNKLSRII